MKEMVAKVLNFYSHPSKRWKKRFWGPKFQNLKGEHAYGVSRTSDVAGPVYTVDILSPASNYSVTTPTKATWQNFLQI